MKFDLEGLSQRILALPMQAGPYRRPRGGRRGPDLLPRRYSSTDPEVDAALYRYDLKKRKEETLSESADGFRLSADGKKRAAAHEGRLVHRRRRRQGRAREGKLDVGRIQVKLDPRAEWAQIFDEAWRINRDYFYDPDMHGADWPAMRKKYEAFLPDVATRDDLYRVIRWMLQRARRRPQLPSRRRSGLRAEDGAGRPARGRLRGRDGRYRFKKVYGGLNWTPDLRAPLTAPGVDVEAGEYLLAVDGTRAALPGRDLYSRFEHTAGKLVEITVGPNADGTGSRTVKVVPIENEGALRNRDWVEGNLRHVHGGDQRPGRLRLRAQHRRPGHTLLQALLLPAGRQARRSSSTSASTAAGRWPTTTSTSCAGRSSSYWAMRYGADLKTPSAGDLRARR